MTRLTGTPGCRTNTGGGRSAATLADRVDRFLSQWPAWFRDDRGSYDRTAIRWWGLALVAAGALPVLSVLAGLADKGRAGQAHALLILPLAALGAVMFAIGRLSARYRRKQTTVQSPLTSVLVSVVSFAVFLLAMILTRCLALLTKDMSNLAPRNRRCAVVVRPVRRRGHQPGWDQKSLGA